MNSGKVATTPNGNGRAGYPYWYNFTIRGILGGQSGSQTLQVDASNDFEALQINLSANLSNGVQIISRQNLVGGSTANDGTANFTSLNLQNSVKLPRDASQNGATATLPGLHLIRLAFKTNDRDWQNEPLRADLYSGEPGKLWFFPRPMIIPANSTITCQAFNDFLMTVNDGSGAVGRGIVGQGGNTPVTVDLQVSLFGSKLKRVG